MIIKILVCINMLAITYQDFRYRAIHWALFLSLATLLAIDGMTSQPARIYGFGVIFNVSLILLQFSILYLVYSLSGKTINDILNKIIGTGDIVLIITLAFAFSWQSFLFYYIGAMLFSILIWLTVRKILNPKCELIPFAGLMSLFCFVLFVCEMIFPGYNRFNNNIFTSFFNG